MTFPDTHRVFLGETLTIKACDALRAGLSDGLRESTLLELDCVENPEVDLWFAQLIISFGKAAQRQAATIALSPRLADGLQSILERGGFPTPFPQESMRA
jgi:hypothetical protein